MDGTPPGEDSFNLDLIWIYKLTASSYLSIINYTFSYAALSWVQKTCQRRMGHPQFFVLWVLGTRSPHLLMDNTLVSN
jgi:hypothetical protein